MKLLYFVFLSAVACDLGSAAIRVSRVSDAVDVAGGLPEYGNLAFVFCEGLRDIIGTVEAKTFPLPYELAGVSVRVGGVLAPVLAVVQYASQQERVTIQMPTERRTGEPVTVSQFGETSQLVPQASPFWAFFFRATSPPARPGEVAAYHTDSSLVAWDNPAKPGEMVTVYGTNLTSIRYAGNAPRIGDPSPASAVYLPLTSSGTTVYYDIWVDGKHPEISFLGLAPGLAGIFQVNFRIPTDTPSGYATLMAVRANLFVTPSRQRLRILPECYWTAVGPVISDPLSTSRCRRAPQHATGNSVFRPEWPICT